MSLSDGHCLAASVPSAISCHNFCVHPAFQDISKCRSVLDPPTSPGAVKFAAPRNIQHGSHSNHKSQNVTSHHVDASWGEIGWLAMRRWHPHKAQNYELLTLSIAVENLVILPSSKELVVSGQRQWRLQTSNASHLDVSVAKLPSCIQEAKDHERSMA